jgi:hypothetical protein
VRNADSIEPLLLLRWKDIRDECIITLNLSSASLRGALQFALQNDLSTNPPEAYFSELIFLSHFPSRSKVAS